MATEPQTLTQEAWTAMWTPATDGNVLTMPWQQLWEAIKAEAEKDGFYLVALEPGEVAAAVTPNSGKMRALAARPTKVMRLDG